MNKLTMILVICLVFTTHFTMGKLKKVEQSGNQICTPKPTCVNGAYVSARWGGQYSLKGSSLICTTLQNCVQNNVYRNCVKGSRVEYGVTIEWCNCGSSSEPSGCHIQLRTASWDGGQQYQCTGTCASGQRCIATQTKIYEIISSTGANRKADVYCGCAQTFASY